jgi:predicted Rossmann fold flavoprotein
MKVIVIGGGPAGMMCAGTLAGRSYEVILLDKNEKMGKKLFITGKGRANVTNNCSRDVFLSNVIRNPKFLMSALSAFSPTDTIAFFENLKTPLKTERGDRVFPVSDKSSDIIRR